MKTKTLSLYIHIPFCAKKCAYCDFLSMPTEENTRNNYVRMLLKEIENEAPSYQDYLVDTVFFGGGTPTILRAEQLEEILDVIRKNFCLATMEEIGKTEAEISIECNPGTVSYGELCKLKKAGFNRLSIGLQSADNKELLLLGRIHTWETFLETYHGARKAGFDNINIDLMSALPGQTIESYRQTLHKVLELKPEHISAYSLIIEEGTPFYDRYSGHAEELPDEDVEREMYDLTEQLLAQNGYKRYEISNYAKEGKQCRHNIVYWQRGNYLGLGLGAASLIENVRFCKEENLDKYLIYVSEGDFDKLRQTQETLSRNAQMEEFMFLGLRMMEGVSTEKFRQEFDENIDVVYGKVLQKLELERLIIRTKDCVRLTKRGIDVSNVVLSEFLL